jgi:hypothetical protein
MTGRRLAIKANILSSGIRGPALSQATQSARKLNVDTTLGHAATLQDLLGEPRLVFLAKRALAVVAKHLRRSPIFVLPSITLRKSAELYWHVDYFFLRNAIRPEVISEILHISVPLTFKKFPLCAWPVEIIEKSLTPGYCDDVPLLVKTVRHCRCCGKMKAGDILLWYGGYVHRSAPAYRGRHLATLQMTVALTPRAKDLFVEHIAERAMMPGEQNNRYRGIAGSYNIRSQIQRRVGSRQVRSG